MPGAGNLISGNLDTGILITSVNAFHNQVQGNFIGTDVSGTTAIPNANDGVFVGSGAASNTIGGTSAGAGNTIAYNGGDGVSIASGAGNGIRQNAIFANGGLGIGLSSGGNNLLPAPLLTSAVYNATTHGTKVTGTLTGLVANTKYALEFFSNPTSKGQGQTYVGTLIVTTDGRPRNIHCQPDGEHQYRPVPDRYGHRPRLRYLEVQQRPGGDVRDANSDIADGAAVEITRRRIIEPTDCVDSFSDVEALVLPFVKSPVLRSPTLAVSILDALWEYVMVACASWAEFAPLNRRPQLSVGFCPFWYRKAQTRPAPRTRGAGPLAHQQSLPRGRSIRSLDAGAFAAVWPRMTNTVGGDRSCFGAVSQMCDCITSRSSPLPYRVTVPF